MKYITSSPFFSLYFNNNTCCCVQRSACPPFIPFLLAFKRQWCGTLGPAYVSIIIALAFPPVAFLMVVFFPPFFRVISRWPLLPHPGRFLLFFKGLCRLFLGIGKGVIPSPRSDNSLFFSFFGGISPPFFQRWVVRIIPCGYTRIRFAVFFFHVAIIGLLFPFFGDSIFFW